MTTRIICSPSWSLTEIADDDLKAVTSALTDLIRRDGVDTVSDTLCEHDCWQKFDLTLSHTESSDTEDNKDIIAVEGYGYAFKELPDDNDYINCFGLLTDGTIMITHYPSKTDIAIDPHKEDAYTKIDSFATAIA